LTYRIVVRQAAELDLVRARDWYIAEAPQVVPRFESELDAAFQRIGAAPRQFRTVVRDARRAHLRVFPYEIWFREHEQLQVVEVIAVVHDRQDLAKFQERVD
jgi:plasmid stabilization system protein ParE